MNAKPDRHMRIVNAAKEIATMLLAMPPTERRDVIDKVVEQYIRGPLHPKHRARKPDHAQKPLR